MKHTRPCAALLAALLLASCAGEVPPVTTAAPATSAAPAATTVPATTATEASDTLTLIDGGKTDYTILYAASEEYGRATALTLSHTLREKTHGYLLLTSDTVSEEETADAPEIVVGCTPKRSNCSALRAALAPGQFTVRVIGSRLFLLGGDEEGTRNAVNYFLKNIVTDSKTLTLPADFCVDSADAIPPALTWDGAQQPLFYGTYLRMISLPDGSLLAAYSTENGIELRSSADDGKTWSSAKRITKREKSRAGETLTYTNANVFLMTDGTLMASYRAHSPLGGSKPFYTSIRYQTSRDGGKSWSDPKIVAEYEQPTGLNAGFWEPHMMTLPDGRLAIYYASDCVGTGDYPFVPSKSYQHIIMHIYDAATDTFGAPSIASNGVTHNSRDGMPVVCRLADGGCVMVIESNAEKDYLFIQMLFSEDGIRWGDPVTVIHPGTEKKRAGAPYVTLLPDGRLALSCQSTEFSGTTNGSDSVHNGAMNVYISNEVITLANAASVTAESFTKVTPNPFAPGKNGYSVWSATVVHNGALYCTASCGTNKDSGGSTALGLFLRRADLATLPPLTK